VPYGDIAPQSDKERLLAMALMCISVVLLAAISNYVAMRLKVRQVSSARVDAKKQVGGQALVAASA
jgi:flagellar basal body-associated protein FliL